MPVSESKDMEEFLLWLLSGLTDKFTTSSSDIAGFAACLSHLGIDTLSVEGLGYQPRDTSCRLIYSKRSIVPSQSYCRETSSSEVFKRELSTTVPLLHPEESIVYFPTSLDIHNCCRHAWKAGQRAANYVALGVMIPKGESYVGDIEVPDDLRYSFLNRGTETQRVNVEMQALASAHAFVMNQELLMELQSCLGRESLATLTWLNFQTSRSDIRGVDITDPVFNDGHRINAY